MLLRISKYLLFALFSIGGIVSSKGQSNIVPLNVVDMAIETIESNCPIYPDDFSVKNITESNLGELEICLREYYRSIPLILREENLVDENEAVDRMMHMINSLLSTPTEQICFTNSIYEYVYNSFGNSTDISFFFEDSTLPSAYQLSGAYLNLEKNSEPNFTPVLNGVNNIFNYSITVPESHANRCYAISGQCSLINAQSSYHFIIIIEKDLGFDEEGGEVNEETIPGGPTNTPSVQVGGGGTSLSFSDEMLLFPNPVKNKQSTLQFELNTTQEVSVYILNNTGQIIHSIANKENYSPGIYHLPLATQQLAPGIYFVVLEREGKRSIEKLVVL